MLSGVRDESRTMKDRERREKKEESTKMADLVPQKPDIMCQKGRCLLLLGNTGDKWKIERVTDRHDRIKEQYIKRKPERRKFSSISLENT